MIDQMNNSPDDHVDEISLDDNSSARTEEDLISTRTNSISGADLGEDESISDNHSISTNSEQSSSSHSQQTHLEDSHSSTEICSRASSANSHKLTHFEQNFMKPDLYHRISPSCYYKPLVLPVSDNTYFILQL
jgi:hypothetical protein